MTNDKPFTLKLADKLLPSGKVIVGKEQSFDRASDMADWYYRQTPIKKKVVKEEKEIKKPRTLKRINKKKPEKNVN